MVVERGEGAYVFDTHGNRYVDGLSSLFCAQIGYSYGEEMGAVAAQQLQQLAFNTIWGTAHPPALELADRLAGLAPDGIDRVFFTSGGSEAVEAAWKLARQYHVANGEPQRLKAIARQHRLPRRHARRALASPAFPATRSSSVRPRSTRATSPTPTRSAPSCRARS